MLLLSVVVPTYNRAAVLERCLRSVLACHLEDIEILVADNASTDGTQQVLGSLRDGRLRFWRNQTNVGAQRNILNLLRAARGEWIFCLADDDYLLFSDALERLIHIVTSDTDVGVVLSSLKIVSPNGDYLWTYRSSSQTGRFSSGMEALSQMVWATHIISRVTVRRRWLDLGGTERYLSSEYAQMYFVGAILKEHAGFYLDECLVAHTIGNQVFWKYQKDFMVGPRIEMFKEMLPGAGWKSERGVLIEQVIGDIAKFHMPLSWSKSVYHWMCHQIALLRIREVVSSRRYWCGLFRFMGATLRRRLRSLIAIGKGVM